MLERFAPEFAQLTTLRLGGTAIALLEPENQDDLAALPERARALGGRLFYLGRGSNLLAASGRHALVLVRMTAWQELRIAGHADGKTLVYAGAGVPLARLLRFCAANGLSGLEGLTGIPGNVGGACAMNAGSFGSETGTCLEALEVFAGTELARIGKEKLNICYRSLKVADSADLPLICGAIFALTSVPGSVILQRMGLNIFKKKSGQPVTAWTAGCAFKNPPGQAAGRLLEVAGFRGRRLGGMFFSPRHANFLVNDGSGTSEQAFELLAMAAAAVRESAGVALESEIQLLH